MQTRRIGPFEIYPLGLGAMPLSSSDKAPGEKQAIATVHAALDAGITFIDTADIYAPSWDTMGHNEEIVARALASYGASTDHVVVGTKAGITRGPGETWGRDGSLAYLRTAVEASLRRLGRDVIDLFQWHRPDRSLVRRRGRSLQDAAGGGQGPRDRDLERQPRADRHCQRGAGCGWLGQRPERVLPPVPQLPGRAGALRPARHRLPTLESAGRFRKGQDSASVFAEIGDELGVSPQQVVLAWELSLGDHVVPIPGASRPETITDSAQAASLRLDAGQLARIEASLG